MDIKKAFIFVIFALPVLLAVTALMAVFGLVGSFFFEIGHYFFGSSLGAALLSGVSGLALVAFMRYGVFRRLPFKRLELKDVYGWYIAFSSAFLSLPIWPQWSWAICIWLKT